MVAQKLEQYKQAVNRKRESMKAALKHMLQAEVGKCQAFHPGSKTLQRSSLHGVQTRLVS
jgi:hypothetical protein